nr:MAG: DNA pilot protein [Microvirus sp.]
MLVSGLAAGAMAGAQIGTDLYNTYQQTKIARQNLQFQRENLAYQKDVQNTEWNREDNAVQRRKADLIAAGLSPVLAAGSAANAGPVVATQAPRRDPVIIPDTAAKVMALMRGKQDIAQSQAQIDLTNNQKEAVKAQTEGTKIDNAIKARDLNISKQAGLPSQPSGIGKAYRDASTVVKTAIDNQVKAFKDRRINIFGHDIYNGKKEKKK